MDQNLKVRIVATEHGVKAVVDDVSGNLNRVAVSGQRVSRSMQGTLDISRRLIRTLAIGAGAWLSYRGAANLLEDFGKQEQAVAALEASIASMGRTTDGLAQNLQQLASQIQREGILGDEAIIEGQSFLATYGPIADELLPRATRLMVDLAAKMGGNVVSAANAVGKASMGMVGELSRIGITFSDAARESKDFELLLSEMESQVGGMNRALGATRSGGLQGLKNDIGDTKELLGGLISVVVDTGLPHLSALVGILNDDLTAALEGNESAIADWSDSMITAIRTFALGTAGVIDTLEGPFDLIKGVLGELWEGYRSLPEWVQQVGIVGALVGGRWGRWAVGIAAAIGAIKNQVDEYFREFEERSGVDSNRPGPLGALFGADGDPENLDDPDNPIGKAERALRAFFARWDAEVDRRRNDRKPLPVTVDIDLGGAGFGSPKQSQFDALYDKLYPSRAAADQFYREFLLLQEYLEGPDLEDAINKLNQRFRDNVKVAKESGGEVAQIYKDTATSIQGAFRDTFRQVFDDGLGGFRSLGDRMSDVFKDTLADMAALRLAQPLILPVAVGLGSVFGISNSAQASLYQQLGGTLDSDLLAAAGVAGSGFGLASLGTFGTGLKAALPGFLGGAGGGFGAATGLTGTLGLGSTALGAWAGAALPWVGGAALLNSITGGGLFGTGWRTTGSGFELEVGGGDVSGREFVNQKKKGRFFSGTSYRTDYSDIDPEILADLNASLDAGIETLFAGAAGLGAETAEQIISGFTSRAELNLRGKDQAEIQQAIDDWLEETVAAMGRAVLRDTRFAGLLIDAGAQMTEAIFGIGGFLGADPVPDAAELDRLAGRTVKERYDDQRRALVGLIGAFDGSLEASQKLAAATQERYETELELLRQINAVRLNVDDIIGGTVEDIRQSLLNPSELFDYLTGQAEGLADQLAGATDPARIQELVDQVDQLTGRAYGLLPEGARGQFAQGFIDFLEGVRETAGASLDRAEEEVVTLHTHIATIIGEKMERASGRLIDAAIQQEEAALEQLEAAREIRTTHRVYQQRMSDLIEQQIRAIEELQDLYQYER